MGGTSRDDELRADHFAAAWDLASFLPSIQPLSVSQGGLGVLTLRAGAENGGARFFVFGSATGTSPGVPLEDGFVLPIVPDAYFALAAMRTIGAGGIKHEMLMKRTL